jgi:hypothetical protein
MAKSPPKPGLTLAASRSASRNERQAAALRENLRRRKAGPAPAGTAKKSGAEAPPPSSGPLSGDNPQG